MNIQEENSSHYFQVQNEREQTLVLGLDQEWVHVYLDLYQVVTTSIRSRPGEGSCLPRLIPGINYTSTRSRPEEGPCHPRLVPGSNYQY